MTSLNKLVSPQSRRDFLKLAAVGAVGGSAGGWLDVVAQKAYAQQLARQAKAKACIVLFMSGGPAHTYTFDFKSGDRCCPYSSIATSTPGIAVSEYMPHIARQMHHLALVRGMSTAIADHEPAHYLMRTGFQQLGGVNHPHMGAIAATELVAENTGMPNFVLIKPGSGGLNGASGGFLGPAARPLILRDVTQGIANLNPQGSAEQLQRRTGLLQGMDQSFLDDYQAEAIRSRIANYRRAAQLMDLDKARTAFRTDLEPQHVRNLYGDSLFGRQCLGARRLVEAGVKYVEVMHPAYWDTHGGAANGQRTLTQVLDRPMGALLEDLHLRGLLEETLVVWMGEFGRDSTGNDHYAKAWTTCFAGAGVRGGRVIGRTDRRGMTVEDRPVSVADFGSTIFKTLGIDYTKRNNVAGRPIGLVDEHPSPVDELFA